WLSVAVWRAGDARARLPERPPPPPRLPPRRSAGSACAIRRLRGDEPVSFVLYDVPHLAGRPTADRPYADRRQLLEDLDLTGPAWQTAPSFPRSEAAGVRSAARAQGLPAVTARRLAAPYQAGRSPDWIRVEV